MKLIAAGKVLTIGLIVITVLAFTLIQVFDFPIMSTKTEMTGNLNEIYQSQARWHIGEDELLFNLIMEKLFKQGLPQDLTFEKGRRHLFPNLLLGS